MKTFGCLCYANTSPKQCHKFQDRAKACVFLGYPTGCKGYKLLDLQSNSIFVSRNVVFYEDMFPFHRPEISHDVQIFFAHIGHSSPETEATASESPSPPVATDSARRVSKPSSHLQDYHCYAMDSSTEHPISNVVSYAELSDYMIFINAVHSIAEPSTYAQARKFREWCEAMGIEITALEDNDTWLICSLPAGKKAVGCKWVYKVKLNADGTLERFKARLVAKGYTQQEGLDYVETFLLLQS